MLPVGNFKRVPKREIKSWTEADILNLPSQSRTGYAFEVDLHYPEKYHEVSNRFLINTNAGVGNLWLASQMWLF